MTPLVRALEWISAPGRASRLLFAGCALSVVLEGVFRLFGHSYDHLHFGYEGWLGFHAGWGFVTFAALVAAARVLGALTRRDEDYYAAAHEPDASGHEESAGA
ncbi:MAG: hypothetical protein AAF725_08135 [Acidobacteriota bacterium]